MSEEKEQKPKKSRREYGSGSVYRRKSDNRWGQKYGSMFSHILGEPNYKN